MRINIVEGTISPTGSGTGPPPPQALWIGNFDSNSVVMMAWPPSPQTLINFTTPLTIKTTATTGTLASPINPGNYAFTMAGAQGAFGPEYHNCLVASDGVSCTFTTNLTSTGILQNSGPGGVAQALYDAVDSYNYYRSTSASGPWTLANTLTGTPFPVLNNDQVSTGSLLQPWFNDIGLSASTNYFYYATATLNGQESSPSPIQSFTTLSATPGSTPPNPPTDPATWLKPNTPPTGATTFVCNNSTDLTNNLATASSNLAGNYIFQLTAGAVFQAPTANGWQIPMFTGNVWFVSSQALEINGSGTLPAFRSDFPKPIDTVFNVTASLAINSTSATLAPNQAGLTDSSGNWLLATAYNWTIFIETATGAEEQRLVSYTKGSSAITWPLNFNNPQPLGAACNAQLRVAIENGVTPADSAAMAIMQAASVTNATGVAIHSSSSATTKNIRFVGIWFRPTPGGPTITTLVAFDNNVPGTPPTININPDHIYFDRCQFGISTADPNYAYCTHGIDVTCDHWFINQTYIHGIATFQKTSTTDSNGFFVRGGGPQCIQNCNIEAVSEGYIYGGVPVLPAANIPHDIVSRGNFYIKPLMWITLAPPSQGVATTRPLGQDIKNHRELKCGIRYEEYNWTAWNTWASKETGQFRSFNAGSLDQSSAGQTPITLASPWNACTDINFHDGDMTNLQACLQMHMGDVCATGVNCRYRLSNVVAYENPFADNVSDKGIFETLTTAWVPDFTIDHNTLLVNPVNPQNSSPASQKGIWNTAIGVDSSYSGESRFTGFIDNGAGGGTYSGVAGTVLTVGAFSTSSFVGAIGPVILGRSIAIDHGPGGSGTILCTVTSQLTGPVGGSGTYRVSVSLAQPSGFLVSQVRTTPNSRTNINDRGTVTNNIIGGTWGIYDNTHHGTAAFNGAFNAATSTLSGNLFPDETTAYPAGNDNNVAYTGIGFKNWNTASTTNALGFRPLPGDWNVLSGKYATFSTTAGPIGAITGSSGVTITTSSLAPATVGVPYTQALNVTGGTAPYKVAMISMAPHRRKWCRFDPATFSLKGIPQYNETSTVVLQAWDSLGLASPQVTLTLPVSASGALTVVTTTFPNASNGGMGQWEWIAKGGVPPYVWGPTATLTAGNQWAPATGMTVEPNGFMTYAPTTTSTVNISSVTVTDTTGTQVTGGATSITVDNVLRLNLIDSIDGIIRIPDGLAGKLYGATANSPRFSAAGGTAPYTFSGSIAGLTVGSTGTLAGTVASIPGTYEATITVTDSASNVATATAHMTVFPFTPGTRPAANTGTGLYVAGGLLYDSNNVPFLMRGYDRDHFDQPPSGWGRAMANSSRGGTGSLAVATATYVNDQNNNIIANKSLPVFGVFCYSGNLGTTGTTDPTFLGQIVTYMFNNFSSYSPLQSKWILNFANEWGSYGGGVSQTAYLQAYLGVVATISAISGTTITVNTVSATHPFANSAYGFITGNPANTAQVVNLSAFGGSSGAWTMTSSVALNTSTGGGTINAGVAALRAAGYTNCPIMIDASGGSGYYNLTQVAAQLVASDPQQNLMFSWHPYSAATGNEFQIQSVAISGSNTVLTVNVGSTPQFGFTTFGPFVNGFGGAQSYPQTTIAVSGITGPWASMNGLWVLNNGSTTGGSAFTQAFPWKVTIPFNAASHGLTAGTYVSNSGLCVDGGNPTDMLSRRVADRAQNVCWVCMEFGPYGLQNVNTPTTLQLHEVLQACEAFGFGWNYWAWDDLSGTAVVPETVVAGGYGFVGTNGHPNFTNLNALTLQGGQANLFHPRFSCYALSVPPSTMLP